MDLNLEIEVDEVFIKNLGLLQEGLRKSIWADLGCWFFFSIVVCMLGDLTEESRKKAKVLILFPTLEAQHDYQYNSYRGFFGL